MGVQSCSLILDDYPPGIYLFKVNNRNTRTRCEICSYIVNFEHISHRVLVFLLLYFTPCFSVSIADFEHVIAGWE